MLNSRQLAGLIWLVLFIVWALCVADVRASIRSMLKTLMSPKLLLLFGVVIGAFVFFVWLIWREGRWDSTMLYDTVVFIAVGGIGSVSRAASRGVTYDATFYAKTALLNFEAMALFAFLSDLFPFNFWLEFLVVIPAATLVAVLVVFSEHRKGADQVHRLMSRVQGFIGFCLIGWVIFRLATQYELLLTSQTVISLALPFVLSILFLPVLIFICAVFAYEDAFLVIGFKTGQSEQLIRWKKRRLLLRFGMSLTALQSFRRTPAMQEFAWVKSSEEAQAILGQWSSRVVRTAPAWESEE